LALCAPHEGAAALDVPFVLEGEHEEESRTAVDAAFVAVAVVVAAAAAALPLVVDSLEHNLMEPNNNNIFKSKIIVQVESEKQV